MPLLNILLAVTLVSVVSLVGIIFFGFKTNIKTLTFYLISLASGTMLGGAFLHLIPEALEAKTPNVLLAISGGIFLFFVLEKLLIWRHCHLHEDHGDHHRPVAAKMVLAGDAIHNFIDGVIIASAFLVSPSVGTSITLAIILHEIPQELGDYGILVHGGYTPKQALILNLVTATTSLAGALINYFFLGTVVVVQEYILPVTAGGFLYIALADLIPQLHEQTSLKQTLQQIFLLATGFGLMVLLKQLPH